MKLSKRYSYWSHWILGGFQLRARITRRRYMHLHVLGHRPRERRFVHNLRNRQTSQSSSGSRKAAPRRSFLGAGRLTRVRYLTCVRHPARWKDLLHGCGLRHLRERRRVPSHVPRQRRHVPTHYLTRVRRRAPRKDLRRERCGAPRPDPLKVLASERFGREGWCSLSRGSGL